MKMGLQQITTVLGRIRYLIHPQALAGVKSITGAKLGVDSSIRPAVVLPAPHALDSHSIFETLQTFHSTDDVFSAEFQDVLVLQVPLGFDRKLIPRSAPGFNSIFTLILEDDAAGIPPGPYFLRNSTLHQAWRLYTDDLDAFVTTVIPDDVRRPKRYSPVAAVDSSGIFRQVAVPSRLYARRSPRHPLAGIRLSLKDNIKLEGTQTTMTNRAYVELYGLEESSAKYAEKLADLGAIILGKTKMTSFASAEEPTDQWVDFHCPVNPRGDRYQTPSGSTSGGGASTAGYDWLDLGIGTDTTGSIRSPAAWNGLFSLRTSYGALPTAGVVESCRLFDVIGIMSRSLSGIRQLLTETSNLAIPRKFPGRLLYPTDFFPQKDPEQQAMTDVFVEQVEKFLGVSKECISLQDLWEQSRPPLAEGKSLAAFLEMSAVWPMYWYNYHAFDDFRHDYKTTFGRDVYVGPYMQFRWKVGSEYTSEQRDNGSVQMDVFRDWFEEHVMNNRSGLLSDAVMIMPFGASSPKYRDQTNPEPSITGTFSPFYFAPVLRLPQLVVPVGQKPYDSRVSGRKEYQPIVSTIVGATGSDIMLLDLAKEVLEAAGRPTEVQTGRFMFEVGQTDVQPADAASFCPAEQPRASAGQKVLGPSPKQPHL